MSQDDICSAHRFQDPVEHVRSRLLAWYDANKRTLPWRSLAASKDVSPEAKGYAVWISEVMLQQTQVTTVIDYYKRWMVSWSSVDELAAGSLTEVHSLWSGLGYYSRATRLLQGAQKIVELKEFPSSREKLLQIPGVGKYTASAVASIAFGEPVGVVDGNVTRVLCRLRAIGKDSSSKEVIDLLWRLVDDMVDKDRSGDFNQAIMELGATICTPKNPSCKTCPLRETCASYIQMDIEDCHLCISNYDPTKGVCNYPFKAKKAKVREESSLSLIIRTPKGRFLLFKRPSKGLLANLLEFYSPPDLSKENELASLVGERLGGEISGLSYIGDVFHQFSHISQTYKVWTCLIDSEEPSVPCLGDYQSSLICSSPQELHSLPISTAMKKVFKLYQKQT
ncbi:hypothetical protein FKW44_016457, partial [Caligus rogercresseyi]